MRFFFSFIITIVLAFTGVHAYNDWDVPCVSGVCHYDLDHDKGGSSGAIKIWGSPKAISDITPAAGWHVLDCEEEDMEQVVRIVCVSPTAPCSHLFSHDGPEGKLVRMPERCGKNPFARVAKAWLSQDQSLPRSLAARLRKMDGLDQVVYNLALDVNFEAVDARHGPVRFAIQAATIPNTDTNIDTHLPLYKRSGRPVERTHKDIVARSFATVKRNIFDHLQHAEEAIKSAANKAAVAVDHVAQNVSTHVANDVKHVQAVIQKEAPKVQAQIVHEKNVAVNAAKKAEATVQKDIPKVKAALIHDGHVIVNAAEHPVTTSKKLKADAVEGAHDLDKSAHKPFNINKTLHFSPKFGGHNITLFKGTFNCEPMHPGLEIDYNPDGSMTGTIGIVVSGTLVPPNLAEFRLSVHLSADIEAVLTINAELTILFDSGGKKILGIPIAGIHIPGILSIGPELELLVQLRFLYDIAVGTRVNVGILVENLQIELPKTSPTPHPSIHFRKGSLKSTPFARGTLQADVHLIPTIAFELDILGKFKNTIDIQADNMIVQKLVIEGDKKTKVINRRGFDDAEVNSRNMVFDVRDLLFNIPLAARSMTELVLRLWRGSSITNFDAQSSTSPTLSRRLTPGPGPWPGGNGPLANTNTTNGPAENACFITYYIIDVSVGAREVFKLFGLSFDQNARQSFYRQVWTLYEHCVGTSQPKGGYTVNNIMSSLNGLKGLIFRRSEAGASSHHFLGHKCNSMTMGGGVMNGPNPYSSVFAFSTTKPLGKG